MMAGGTICSVRSGRDVSVPSYGSASDAELATWSAGGDSRAFDEIVVRHGPFVLRATQRMISDRGTAEDLAQEVMVKAWGQVGRFDPARARFSTWLYKIAVNHCLDHRRKNLPDQMPEDFDMADPAARIDEVMETEERDRAIALALDELPQQQKAAMTLVYDEGLSGAETARVMGVPAKTVERLLARAREQLRRRLLPDQNTKEL